MFSHEKINQRFQLKNTEEFVFGIQYGTIIQYYSNYLTSINRQVPTVEEIEKIRNDKELEL